MFEQYRKSRDDSGQARLFGLGLVLGALAGAAAGLLMAPASGQDTRRRIGKGAERAYNRTAGVLGDAWEDAEGQYRKVSRDGIKRARKQVKRARDMVEDVAGSKGFNWR